jgi:hypothetical protein
MVNRVEDEKEKTKPDETASVIVSSHIKIEDVESGQTVVNQRG